MQKIIISGCSGHMGRVVESLCAADPQVQVAAGFDILGSSDRDFPVFSSPAQFSGEADAVIDFLLPRRPGGAAGLRPGHRDPSGAGHHRLHP